MKRIFLLFLFFVATAAPAISQTTALIDSLNKSLAKGAISVSSVLTSPSFMLLHSLTPFREMIKQNAKAGKLSITTDSEPGTRVTIKGTVQDKTGLAVANKLVYVYQTSAEGWYSDTAAHILMNEGDRRHARLFGYFKTDANGNFEFATIKPRGYPNSSLPAHIHIEIFNTATQSFITELLFDDDPRLTGEIRTRSINEKFLIVKNSGTISNPLYAYTIQVPGY